MFNKTKCMVGQIINDISVACDKFAVMFEHGTEIMAPVSGTETIILIKSPGVRMIGVLHAIVPFAKGSSGIA